MPVPHQATLDWLHGKASVPSDLRTADWQRVPVELRERSFFLAGVSEAEILQQFRDEAQSVAAGQTSYSESRARLHDYLQAAGYRPEPGQEGTIKDLRTARRQTVALQTNVEAARAFGQWKRQQGALAAFPAVRYFRARQAMVPRDWPARWRAALAATTTAGAAPGHTEGDLVALANHPLWTHPGFNQLGSPWPPFAFGSGMMTSPVSRAEAADLGLLRGDIAAMLQPQDRSFNETLQTHPAVTSQPLRAALADHLQGFAEWHGDTLLFTDPNGTRPGAADQVGRWITAPLPVDPGTGQPFPSHQRDALQALADDPGGFVNPRSRHRDQWQDLRRLIQRVAGPEQSRSLLRGLAQAGDDPDSLLGEWLADTLLPSLRRAPAWDAARGRTLDSAPAVEALLQAILSIL